MFVDLISLKKPLLTRRNFSLKKVALIIYGIFWVAALSTLFFTDVLSDSPKIKIFIAIAIGLFHPTVEDLFLTYEKYQTKWSANQNNAIN